MTRNDSDRTQTTKWECSACMTRNDQNMLKCACCEQPKPGSTPENAPQFSFGSKLATAAPGHSKILFWDASYPIEAKGRGGSTKSDTTIFIWCK